MSKTKIDKQTLVMGAVACAAALSATSSKAETPLSLTVSQELTYDSNVLKDNNNKRRDAISATGLQVGFNKTYGRQTYKASGTVVKTKYKNTKEYDNDGYNASLGMSSSLLANWYVSADYSSVKQQQNPEDQGNLRYRENVVVDTASVFLQYGMYGKWSVNSTIDGDKYKYDVRKDNDRSSNGLRLGVRYSPTDLLYFDVGVKKSEIDYPKYILAAGIGDKIHRTDYDLNSKWIVTGYSQFTGRVGWTQERHDGDSRRDFDGLTGRVSWIYTPTGKMTYTVALDRDTNNAGGYTTGQFFNAFTFATQNRVTTGLSLAATWAATSKISVKGGLVYKKIDEELSSGFYEGDAEFIPPGAALGSGGYYKNLNFGLTYRPFRSTTLACSVSQYKRSGAILSRNYDGEEVNCSAVFSVD